MGFFSGLLEVLVISLRALLAVLLVLLFLVFCQVKVRRIVTSNNWP